MAAVAEAQHGAEEEEGCEPHHFSRAPEQSSSFPTREEALSRVQEASNMIACILSACKLWLEERASCLSPPLPVSKFSTLRMHPCYLPFYCHHNQKPLGLVLCYSDTPNVPTPAGLAIDIKKNRSSSPWQAADCPLWYSSF